MNILIKNVKLVDYNQNFKGDILIKEGIISKGKRYKNYRW